MWKDTMTAAKYGSRGETTLRLPMSLRDRLKVVAALEQRGIKESCTMIGFIERRVVEAEGKYLVKGGG